MDHAGLSQLLVLWKVFLSPEMESYSTFPNKNLLIVLRERNTITTDVTVEKCFRLLTMLLIVVLLINLIINTPEKTENVRSLQDQDFP